MQIVKVKIIKKTKNGYHLCETNYVTTFCENLARIFIVNNYVEVNNKESVVLTN